jgi:ribosomal protein S18 acetylase RimI-like enzyme
VGLEVVPFKPDHLAGAARLWSARLHRLRRRVPALPVGIGGRRQTAALLADRLDPAKTLVAMDGDVVVGYLGWVEYADFRGTGVRGAHSPEHGNAATASRSADAWRALYGVAAARWFEAGCRFHAVTCLAGDPVLERTLAESGFGMLLRDALRPLTGIEAAPAPGTRVRRATADDGPALAELEVEHRRHYGRPPVLMIAPPPDSEADLVHLVETAPNTIWLAEADGRAQGFLRFEAESHGAARISLSPTTISVTGAYVRPEWRGRGAARVMLARAIDHYRLLGFERMALDYETINPEALAFWPRFFKVIATSYMRVPERT